MSLKDVSKNGIWLITEKAVRSIMTLLVGAWVVRHLGPEKYGQISYVIAFISFFQSIASLGIDGVLIREIIFTKQNNKDLQLTKSEYNKSIDEYSGIYINTDKFEISNLITSVFFARALSGVVLLTISTILIGLLKNWDTNYILLTLFIGGSLIFQAADTFDLWNQSQLNSRQTVIAKLLAYISSNGLRIYLIQINAELIWFGLAFFIETFIVAAVLYLKYRNHNPWKFNSKKIIEIIKRLFSETWPLMVSSLSAAVYTRFDQIALERFLGEKYLGIYSAAIIFASATYFLPGIICTSVMPVLTNAKNKSEKEYISILRMTYLCLLLTSIIIAIITYVASDLLLNRFYGEKFHEGNDILRIYSLSNIPVYLGVAHGLWMVNDRKLAVSLYRSISGAMTSMLLCIIFVPQYGMIAAAYSTIVALLVSDIIIPVLINKKLFKQILNLNMINENEFNK